jgi:hypothetical protein
MTAVDVRASAEIAQADVTHGSYEDAPRARSAYSSESDYDGDRGGYSESYAGGEAYQDNSYDSYPDNFYDAYAGYDYDSYPSFGYGYSPYPFFFFVDRDGSFRRFQRRDRRFDGRRGGRGGFREGWRERDFRGRRGTSIAVGPRGSRRLTRPAFERGGFGRGPQAFRGPRGRAVGRGGFGPPSPGRGSLPSGFRGPRGGAGVHRDFGSGGPHAGRGFSPGRTGFSGGGRASAGPTGGRARH